MRASALRLGLVLSVGLAFAACGDDVGGTNSGGSSGSSGGSSGATGGTGGTSGTGGSGGFSFQNDGGTWICVSPSGLQVTCACNDGIDNDGDGLIDLADPDCVGPNDNSESSGGCGSTQCTNCIDDDHDGLIDSADPDCTGPLDNDESSLATGIPGDNMDACHQDCFFDGNSGSGDDGCKWNPGCDPSLASLPEFRNCHPDAAECASENMQSQQCIQHCMGVTPNGCDCFGCCAIFDSSGTEHDVFLSPSCNPTTFAGCTTCTPTTNCLNPCDPCEFCLGRPPLQSCTSDGGVPDGGGTQCPNNETPCNPIDPGSCPSGYYCLTGCCIPNIP